MEGRVEVSSDAVCQGNGAYLEAHAPAALLAKIYLSMVTNGVVYFLRAAPAQVDKIHRKLEAAVGLVTPKIPKINREVEPYLSERTAEL